MLTTAHERMSSLTEEMAGQFRHHRSEDEVYTELLHEAQELTLAMKAFLEGKQQCEDGRRAGAEMESVARAARTNARRTSGRRTSSGDSGIGIVALLNRLSAAVPLCRARRQELSLVLVETNCPNMLATADKDATLLLRQALERVCRSHSERRDGALDHGRAAGGDPARLRAAASGGAGERSARRAWRRRANKTTPRQRSTRRRISAGVATVAAVPKNFDPWRLVESAERCLYAARSCNTNAVKSIEI